MLAQYRLLFRVNLQQQQHRAGEPSFIFAKSFKVSSVLTINTLDEYQINIKLGVCIFGASFVRYLPAFIAERPSAPTLIVFYYLKFL